MNVLIIGAGNMGTTFGQSFINASAISPAQLYFMDHQAVKADLVSELSHHPLAFEATELTTEMDLIILAVKPQDFPELASKLKGHLEAHQLILSIMAGLQVDAISEALGIDKIVRAMPNLPAQIGRGMTVFTTSPSVTRLEIFTVQNLLNTTGKTLHTPSEPMIDAATAVSGSGPAFVYFFMSAMMEAAREMGFSDSEAQLLVRQTFSGSVSLLRQSNRSSDDWIAKVASRGGTTEAALAFWQQKDLKALIAQGLETARKRAEFLSGS
ncbi:MAG: pyrroline-5-carboxylate reductase [Bacteroidota bacterium]